MAVAKLDQNSRPTLTAMSSANDGSIVELWADPTLHALLTTDAGSGTVTSVSVVSANGFAGSVATATSTPAITLSTTINSPLLSGNGTAIAAATTTGSGSTAVLQTSPTLVTPVLGVATATSMNGLTITPSTGTITITNAKVFAVTNSLTLSGTDSTVMTFPTTSATIARTDAANTFTGIQTFNGTVALGAQSLTMTGSIAATGARVTKGWFTDVESTNMYTVGGTSLSSVTQTLSNKRVTRRLTTANAPGATPTTNTDNVDIMSFTGLGTAITSMTTNLSGTPVDGDLIEFRFTDDGTARAITWGASFASTTVTLPATTVISTMLRVGLEFSGSTWKCIAVA